MLFTGNKMIIFIQPDIFDDQYYFFIFRLENANHGVPPALIQMEIVCPINGVIVARTVSLPCPIQVQ